MPNAQNIQQNRKWWLLDDHSWSITSLVVWSWSKIKLLEDTLSQWSAIRLRPNCLKLELLLHRLKSSRKGTGVDLKQTELRMHAVKGPGASYLWAQVRTKLFLTWNHHQLHVNTSTLLLWTYSYGATPSNQRKEKISPSLFIHQFTVWVSTSTLKPWVIFIIINLPFVKGPLIAVAAARTFAWISQVNINMWPLHVFQEPPKTAQCLMIDNKRACRKWKPPSFIFMNSMSFWLSISGFAQCNSPFFLIWKWN